MLSCWTLKVGKVRNSDVAPHVGAWTEGHHGVPRSVVWWSCQQSVIIWLPDCGDRRFFVIRGVKRRRSASFLLDREGFTGLACGLSLGHPTGCAPGIRSQAENRDWDDYARRTARYAFGAAGDRQTVVLEKYRKQWASLEGQPAQRPGYDRPSI